MVLIIGFWRYIQSKRALLLKTGESDGKLMEKDI